jgi:hypothetical protein
MTDKPAAKDQARSERLSTIVTVLIAVVSTIIAIVASQAAVVSGNSAEAQHNGVLAKINLERIDGGTWAEVARNQRAFAAYRFNRALYSLTFGFIEQAEADGASSQGTRLRLEAAGQLEESNLAFNYVESGYLLTDEAGSYASFDVDNFVNDRRQTAAIYQDIDFADNFADADRLLALSASLLGWFIALMFLTWAEVTRSALRYLWLAAGLVLALAITLAYVVVSVFDLL